jgi:prepilin-type N-terminal cleavage/methylation domain-containing protein/prepilin-type processing-associated H-X9-DG protein
MVAAARSAQRPRSGFTLIELLVVIAIIGVLIALLLPAVQKVREAALNLQCRNNLKQIGLGLHNFENTNGKFPDGSYCTGTNNCYQDWAISILPYVEQQNLFVEFSPTTLAEDQPASAREYLVKLFVCPSDTSSYQAIIPYAGPALSKQRPFMPGTYKAVEGVTEHPNMLADHYWDRYDNTTQLLGASGATRYRGVLHTSVPDRGFGAERVSDITDGLSNTIMVGEYCTLTADVHRGFWAYSYWEWNQSSVSWNKPYTLLPSYDQCAALDPSGDKSPCKRGWSSLHTGGINFLLCDGSVRILRRTIDMVTLAELATIAEGVSVGGDF